MRPSEKYISGDCSGSEECDKGYWDAYHGSEALDLLKKLSENYDFAYVTPDFKAGAQETVEALLHKTGRLP